MQIRQTTNVFRTHPIPTRCLHGRTVPLRGGTVPEARRSREACAQHAAEDDVFLSLPTTVHASPKRATYHMDSIACRCNRCGLPGCLRRGPVVSEVLVVASN